MNTNAHEGDFIPCGDSLEKMGEIDDSALENVAGGFDRTRFIRGPYSMLCSRCWKEIIYYVRPKACPYCGSEDGV